MESPLLGATEIPDMGRKMKLMMYVRQPIVQCLILPCYTNIAGGLVGTGYVSIEFGLLPEKRSGP